MGQSIGFLAGFVTESRRVLIQIKLFCRDPNIFSSFLFEQYLSYLAAQYASVTFILFSVCFHIIISVKSILKHLSRESIRKLLCES